MPSTGSASKERAILMILMLTTSSLLFVFPFISTHRSCHSNVVSHSAELGGSHVFHSQKNLSRLVSIGLNWHNELCDVAFIIIIIIIRIAHKVHPYSICYACNDTNTRISIPFNLSLRDKFKCGCQHKISISSIVNESQSMIWSLCFFDVN